jgi:hypothetical protein
VDVVAIERVAAPAAEAAVDHAAPVAAFAAVLAAVPEPDAPSLE